MRRLFRRIGERAGTGAVVPYQLRHAAASLLLDNDATIEEVDDLLSDNPTTSYQHYRHRLRASAGAPSPRSSASSGRRMAAAVELGGQPALVAATQQRSRVLTRGFSVGRSHSYSNSPDVRERVLTVVRIAAETGHTVERCYQNVIA